MDESRRAATASDLPVERLEFDIEWPPGHAAAYLVETPAPVLVDAGVDDDAGRDALTDQLAAAGYAPSDVAAVVITHPHSDHVGQVPLLRDAGATVYAPASALDRLRRDADDLRESVLAVARSVGLDADRAAVEADRAVASLERDRRLLDPDETVGFAHDEPFRAGDREFVSLHTPGHQIDHASLRTTVGDTAVLFSGDALIETFRAAILDVGFDDGVFDALRNVRSSMDRLERVDAMRVYPGHGPVFTDVDGAVTSTRASLDRLVEGTRDALAEVEPATPFALARHRFGEFEYPAPLLDTIGALGELEATDAVRHDTRDGVRSYVRT